MNKIFYKKQKELIDIAISILKKEMPKYQEEYKELFYKKKVPPHISQPLESLKNKITHKPVYAKISKELNIPHRKAKKIVNTYGFSYVLQNLEKFKEKTK